MTSSLYRQQLKEAASLLSPTGNSSGGGTLQDGLFWGSIFEDMVPDIVDKDGGGLSKPKKPTHHQIAPDYFREVTKKRQPIVLTGVPTDSGPGQLMYMEEGMTTEFYSDMRILEATDEGDVVTALLDDGPPREGQFHLRPHDKDSEAYVLQNVNRYCVVLSVRDEPKLVSITAEEIKRQGPASVVEYITVFKTTQTDRHSNIALFFSYKNKSQQLINSYLMPCSSDDQQECHVKLESVNVTNLDQNQVFEEHRKHLYFSTEYLNNGSGGGAGLELIDGPHPPQVHTLDTMSITDSVDEDSGRGSSSQ